jgi:hypothetical protein
MDLRLLLPLSGVFALACGPFNEDPGGVDSGGFVGDTDPIIRDGGFFTPDSGLGTGDAGVFTCADFCAAYDQCLLAETREQLRRHGADPTCVTESPGLAECASTCEAEEASAACLRCEAMCTLNCNSDCELKRPTNGRWALEMNQSCWYGRGRPAESCSSYESITSFSGSVRPDGPLGRFDQISYVGTATVVSTNPLRLRTPDGAVFVVEFEGLSSANLVPDELVQFEFAGACPWWCSTAFVLRTASGALLAAGWSGREPLEMPELTLAYGARACVGASWAYSHAIDLELTADEALIPVGTMVDVAGLRVANGRSVVHYAIIATDHPSVWTEGLIVMAP